MTQISADMAKVVRIEAPTTSLVAPVKQVIFTSLGNCLTNISSVYGIL